MTDEDNDPHTDQYYFRAGLYVSLGMGVLIVGFLYGLHVLEGMV